MVEVTSLFQHSSGQLVLVNTVKVNPFGQLNNPVGLHKATPMKADHVLKVNIILVWLFGFVNSLKVNC